MWLTGLLRGVRLCFERAAIICSFTSRTPLFLNCFNQITNRPTNRVLVAFFHSQLVSVLCLFCSSSTAAPVFRLDSKEEQSEHAKPRPALLPKPRRKLFFNQSKSSIDLNDNCECVGERRTAPELLSSADHHRHHNDQLAVQEGIDATVGRKSSADAIPSVLIESDLSPVAEVTTGDDNNSAKEPESENFTANVNASKPYSSIRSLKKKGRSLSNRLVGLFSNPENAETAQPPPPQVTVRYNPSQQSESANVTLEVPAAPDSGHSRHLSVPNFEAEAPKDSSPPAESARHQRQHSLNSSPAGPSAIPSIFYLPATVLFPGAANQAQNAAEVLNDPAKLLLSVSTPPTPKLTLPSTTAPQPPPVPTISNHERLERLYGADLLHILVCDHTKSIPLPARNKDSTLKSLVHNTTMNVVSNTGSDQQSSHRTSSSKSPEEIETLKRQKADEYYRIEDKQSRLCKALAQEVYRKLEEENAKQHFCEPDEMQKIFYAVIELEKLSSLVHEQTANEIRARLDTNWDAMPYFGDILLKFYHFYKTYKPILERFPTCQVTLANCTKRKPFQTNLQKLLVSHFHL